MTTQSYGEAAPAEVVVAVFRRHGVGLVPTAIRVVATAAALGVIYAFIGRFVSTVQPWRDLVTWTFWTVCVLCGIWIAFGSFRAWASPTMVLTNSRVRIRYRRGQQGWEIPLAMVLDVSASSGLLQRPFGVGTIAIRTTFAPKPALMFDVEAVRATKDEITALRNQYWARYPFSKPLFGQDWNVQPVS